MAEGLEPGVTIAGRYVVESLVGSGGIAEVYRVRHTELGSVHALKVLTWKRKSLADRFLREGQFQARLGHPNVVTVTDILRFDGHVALVMEFVDGSTLEDYLAERGALPVQEAFALFVPILAAVAAAHDRGVLHRDLKPANVLLANTPVGWVPKVVDFGIAKFVQEEMGGGDTTAGMVMGSPGYMAPEQIRDSSTVDKRADVFALGAILYELLTGRRAFADQDGGVSLTSTLDREPPVLEVPGVSPEIAAAVRRALARDREQRFADCRSMARGLGIGAHPLLLDAAERAAQPPSFDGGRFTSPFAPSTLNGPPSGGAGGTEPPRKPGSSTSPLVVLSFATAGTVATLAVLLLGVMGIVVLAAVGARWSDRPEAVPTETLAPLEPPDAGDVAPEPEPAAPEAPEPDVAAPPVVPPPEVPPAAPVPSPAPPVEPEGDGVAEVEPEAAPPEPAPEPAPEPEPEVAAVAPVPAPTPPPQPAPEPVDLSGTWSGKADGRPFELRLKGAGADWTAEATFLVGTTSRRDALAGTFDPATRKLVLRSPDGNVRFDGALSGRTLTGTYRQGRGKTLDWSVSR